MRSDRAERGGLEGFEPIGEFALGGDLWLVETEHAGEFADGSQFVDHLDPVGAVASGVFPGGLLLDDVVALPDLFDGGVDDFPEPIGEETAVVEVLPGEAVALGGKVGGNGRDLEKTSGDAGGIGPRVASEDGGAVGEMALEVEFGELALAVVQAVPGEWRNVGIGVEKVGFHSEVISCRRGALSTCRAKKCEV